MGVRLYPNTKNPTNLEILAGVPEGTYQALEELRKKHKLDENFDFFENERNYSAFYNEKYNTDLDTLDSFLLYGWGKFKPTTKSVGYCGHLDKTEDIQELFHLNYISADIKLCEGVHWS